MVKRSLSLLATLVTASALASHASCIALLCYQDEPCAGEVGGGDATSTTGTGVTSTDATSVTTGAGGTGGAGGESCTADTTTDPLNCGACDVSCAGGSCNAGLCTEAVLDLFADDVVLGGIHVLATNQTLLVVDSLDCDGQASCVHAVPTEFESTTIPAPIAGVPDAAGMWGRGPLKSYYSPQSSRTIFTCDDGACARRDFAGTSSHYNGPAAILGSLFALESEGAHVLKFALDGQGTPTNGDPEPFYLIEDVGSGPHQMFPDAAAKELVFTTYSTGGCLYRENADISAGVPLAQCDSSVPGGASTGPVALAVDPDGNAFVLGASIGPPYVHDGGPQLEAASTTDVRPPIAVDDRYIYARSAIDGPDDGLVILDKLTGAQLTHLLAEPIGSIDASHPDYVFFTPISGDPNRLFRWRKPPP